MGPINLGPKLQNSLSKPPVEEETFTIQLKKLNLDQIVQVGSDLIRNFDDLKMTGITVNSVNDKAGYFDVEFKLSKFYLPDALVKEEEPGDKTKDRRKNRPFRKKDKNG